MQLGAATVENSVETPQKMTNGTALWPSGSTARCVSEEIQNTNLKEHMHPHLRDSIIYNSQDMEAAQGPINKWVAKKAVVHLHGGILLSHEKGKTSYHLQQHGST